MRAKEFASESPPSSERDGLASIHPPFGSHDFSVAATEPSGLDRTKKGGSYTPSLDQFSADWRCGKHKLPEFHSQFEIDP